MPGLASQARQQVEQGQFASAGSTYKELLAHDPFDASSLDGLYRVFDLKYNEEMKRRRYSTARNFTSSFLGNAERHAAKGGFNVLDDDSGKRRRVKVQRISKDLPLFQVDGLLSDAESHAMRQLHLNQLGNMTMGPLICFQNDAFTRHRLLRKYFLRPDPREDQHSARATASCLHQRASKALGAASTWSASTSAYRGQFGITDLISRRLAQHFGLHESHAKLWQLLSYEKGVAYNDHTDCTQDSARNGGPPETLLEQCHQGHSDRAATALIYVSDGEVEGGHTEFPKIGVKVAPAFGRVVLFWGFNSQQVCDVASTHRSNAVSGAR
jgi:hypothetical protein